MVDEAHSRYHGLLVDPTVVTLVGVSDLPHYCPHSAESPSATHWTSSSVLSTHLATTHHLSDHLDTPLLSLCTSPPPTRSLNSHPQLLPTALLPTFQCIPAMSDSAQPFNDLFLADNDPHKPPFYEGKTALIEGHLEEWKGETSTIYSPILRQGQQPPSQCHGSAVLTERLLMPRLISAAVLGCVRCVDGQRIAIGIAPQMGEAEALRAVKSAAKAYGKGLGYWPTCGVATRIAAIQQFIVGLQAKRDEIVQLLMWEICKNLADAQKEVDRTIQYIKDTIAELKKIENSSSTYEVVQGVVGHIRRAPLGTVLCLGPFNYPLNETSAAHRAEPRTVAESSGEAMLTSPSLPPSSPLSYTTFIPALIMGNTVVLKVGTA